MVLSRRPHNAVAERRQACETELRRYADMQRSAYESLASGWSPSSRDAVVGSFDRHNEHAGWDLIIDGLDGPDRVALDVGCGPGRSIVRWWDRFARIDGADIAQRNLDNVRIWVGANGRDPDHPRLFLVDGRSLDGVPDMSYDLVFSTITLQHVCVHSTRLRILEGAFRVLRPGGWLSFQMGVGPTPHTAGYYEDMTDAMGTNGLKDVRVDDPSQVTVDLILIGFESPTCSIQPSIQGDGHPSWGFFRARRPDPSSGSFGITRPR